MNMHYGEQKYPDLFLFSRGLKIGKVVVVSVIEKTQDLLKNFEQAHEIYVSAQDAQTFWMVNARIPKKQESHHQSRKYVSGPNENGNVLICLLYTSPSPRDRQ